MRTGAELNRATRPFMKEDRARTWRLFVTAALLFVLLGVGVVLAPWWPLQLLASVLMALTLVRLFIFVHDHLHDAILHRSRPGAFVMGFVGFYLLAVSSVWRETHDYHHRNNAKLLGSAIGSYPVVTVGMWKGMSPAQRRKYRLARHPLTIFFGYVMVFIFGMCLAAFIRDPRQHWRAPLALLMHTSFFVLAGLAFGWLTGFFLIVLPLMLATGIGSYLFFAQHNFPDIKLRDRRGWDYHFAALHSSSMFDMPGWMHWFTGNIGYHHIHHLNHRIPFYRLPEVYAAVPELQQPGRTSWRPSDVWACLQLAVWDPEEDRMLTWSEVREREGGQLTPAGAQA